MKPRFSSFLMIKNNVERLEFLNGVNVFCTVCNFIYEIKVLFFINCSNSTKLQFQSTVQISLVIRLYFLLNQECCYEDNLSTSNYLELLQPQISTSSVKESQFLVTRIFNCIWGASKAWKWVERKSDLRTEDYCLKTVLLMLDTKCLKRVTPKLFWWLQTNMILSHCLEDANLSWQVSWVWKRLWVYWIFLKGLLPPACEKKQSSS